MYRSSPFRSTLSSKKSTNAKTRPRQKGPKPRKGCVSGSANVPVCGYIYMYNYIYFQNIHIQYTYFFFPNGTTTLTRGVLKNAPVIRPRSHRKIHSFPRIPTAWKAACFERSRPGSGKMNECLPIKRDHSKRIG